MFKTVTFLMLTFFMCAMQLAAQEKAAYPKSNSSRLFVDLELEGVKLPDTVLFNKINLDSYEVFRKADTRVSVHDASSGYTIVLYSQKETDINRAARTPLQRFKNTNISQPKSNH